MNDWMNTRAERQWLATLRRIADALERLADQLEKGGDGDLDAES